MQTGNVHAALSFAGVTKRYARQTVLEDFSLDIHGGEFFGLVGVNGAGKTTCIKSLLDFCAVDAGSIRVFGISHRETRARARLAYLPERFLPPYFLTGREFLDFMARLHCVVLEPDAVNSMLEVLDLDAMALQKPVRQYSKGMAQKLGLAACFLSAKDLIVLDEPMSGLDPKARILVKRHLSSLRAQGRTVFFSTHMLADVEELCDRMGVLHDGRLRFVGPPGVCCETFGLADLEQAYLSCIEGAAQP